MEFEDEAQVMFNSMDMSISCSCRKYESIGTLAHFNNFVVHNVDFNNLLVLNYFSYLIGLLCRHAIRVFNINEVFILPSRYILQRWTKYAKRAIFYGNQGCEKETLQTHAARISRKATSIAIKCSVSKELLESLEKSIDTLDLEADNSLSQRRPINHCGVSLNCNECGEDITKGKVSFRIPQVLKGPKSKRMRNVLKKRRERSTD